MPLEESTLFRPVETKRASEVIFEQVLELIRRGELKPGDRLPSEKNMMEMFQRSRPTVREALRMLENDGMIQVIPGGGATVTMPDDSLLQKPFESLIAMRSIPIEDLIEYRQLTEIAVVGWAAQRRDEKNLKDMECCIQRASDILDRDPVRFFAEDVNFHNIICEASGNQLAPILGKTLHNLVGEVLMTGFNNRDSAGQLAMCDQIVSVHRMIYEAIADRDVEQSQNVMRIHLNNFSLTRRYFPEKRESN